MTGKLPWEQLLAHLRNGGMDWMHQRGLRLNPSLWRYLQFRAAAP